MKFFVISDTHGRLEKVYKVYEKLNNIDMIIHLGDYSRDAETIEETLGVDVIYVRGNMDGAFGEDSRKILETEYGKILLAHGHVDNVKNSYQNILYKAEELGCKAAFFGHTHQPFYGEFNGIHLLNPGSLPLPRGGSKSSYAIVNTTEAELRASIILYDIIDSSSSSSASSKVEGGYLKNLLNNSDRF